MTHLLVVGSPSLDTIHIQGQTHQSVGGAGMYMAMAAWRSGLKVSMFGPRPDTIPDVMGDFASRLEVWIGPVIPLEDMPHFEISHQGDKAVYLNADVESEEQVDFDQLPDDLSKYAGVHITAMGDSAVQMACLEKCRQRGARMISLGTWLGSIQAKPELTHALMAEADIFFMNEEEGHALFGSLEAVQGVPGQILFVTLADKGALVALGNHQTQIPAREIVVKDPTGAGESFCGSALANILLGLHPVMAGRRAAMLAAEKIGAIGASALLLDDPPPDVPLDPRVRINKVQVEKVSQVVKDLPAAGAFNFVADYLPPVGHPLALDYFFAATLQQFGFWETANGRYDKPLIAKLGGELRKGSNYLYYAYLRPLDTNPTFYSPERQANLTLDEMADIFRADDGTVQMPALALHLQQANQYGRDMLALGYSPQSFVQQAMESQTPLKTFMMLLDHIGGYKEDPIRKKSSLLALSVSARPEAFLRYGQDETVAPVVDYHCMRSVLRIGLVEVLDADLYQKLAERRLLNEDEEWAVRYAAYHIQKQVEALSGKPIGAVDWFFFNYMRSHCPEMTDPVCAECALDAVCAKKKEMFQPVLRTTNY